MENLIEREKSLTRGKKRRFSNELTSKIGVSAKPPSLPRPAYLVNMGVPSAGAPEKCIHKLAYYPHSPAKT
jgi:hypothetical protein